MGTAQEIIDAVDSELVKLRQIVDDLKALSLTPVRPDLEQALKLIAGQIVSEEIRQNFAKQIRDYSQKWNDEQKEIARQRASEMGILFPFYNPNKQD